MNLHTQILIEQLGLKPHPEGGFYRENYRAPLQINSPVHGGVRSAFTSIHFLLGEGQYSAWHRVASDESWFFHQGCDLQVFSLLPVSGSAASALQVQTLGAGSGCFELTVPSGRWFAARPVDPDSYTLVSCVVAPGFEFEDFELAQAQQLIDEGYQTTVDWLVIESLLIGSSA